MLPSPLEYLRMTRIVGIFLAGAKPRVGMEKAGSSHLKVKEMP